MTEVLKYENNIEFNIKFDKKSLHIYDDIDCKYIIYNMYYYFSIFNFIKNFKNIDQKYVDLLFPKKIDYPEFKNNLILYHNYLVFDKFQFIYNYYSFYESIKKYHDNFTVNYAVKCLPDQELIKFLIKCHGHFDCASLSEINLILNNGGSENNIIFANPMKPKNTIIAAKNLNIKYTTFDSIDEFYKLYEYAPNINLILRIHVNSIAKINLSNKFGMELEDILDLLKTNHIHLKKIKGLAFHCGSDNSKALGYLLALKRTFEIIEIFEKNNINIEIIDLGGGFPCYNYTKIIDSIFEVYSEKLNKYKLIFEPGRAICSTAVSYIPHISIKNENLYIDNEILYSYFKDSILADRNFCYNKFNIIGDVFIKDINGQKINCKSIDRKFPNYIKAKCIVFENFGAYTISLSPDNINCYKCYI